MFKINLNIKRIEGEENSISKTPLTFTSEDQTATKISPKHFSRFLVANSDFDPLIFMIRATENLSIYRNDCQNIFQI